MLENTVRTIVEILLQYVQYYSIFQSNFSVEILLIVGCVVVIDFNSVYYSYDLIEFSHQSSATVF